MKILLVHGLGGTPRSWTRVRAALDPRLDRQVVAADVRVRTGQSVAEVAEELLDRYHGRYIVVGHSFGGMVALEAALMDSSRIVGLVLISAISGADDDVAAINTGLADSIERRGLDAIAPEFATTLFAPGRLANEPELGAAFTAEMLLAGPVSVCAALRAIAGWDATERLPAIRCPTVVIVGEAEPGGLQRQQILARLVGAELHVVANAGHLVPMEAPTQVAEVISRFHASYGS